MHAKVPELSLADYLDVDPARRAAFTRRLLDGLQRYGFIILRDHLIASASIDAAYALMARFFAQAEFEKRRYIAGARGYAPLGTEHAKDQSAPDLKEFWQIGPEAPDHGAGPLESMPGNLWPEVPAGFRATFLALFDALQATGRVILEALAPALGQPPEFFERRTRERNSVLRLLHYPPVAGDAAAGSVRSAAHEDVNLITLLLAPQGAGLELLDRDGRWLPVVTSRNDLIVDSGDMMARLTNDLIPATTHRVVNPSAENVSRYSMPFFMHPDADVVLRCLPACLGAGARYPPIRAGTFLEQRLEAIGLVKTPDPPARAGR
jgi:isopenicillin N synthase-like dioxygenase